MAWIEVHQSLWDHRKTMEVADALDLPELYAASHLIALWTWALDNAPNGQLPASNRIIAKGAKWTGDPDAFCHALRNAGFLDDGPHGLLIHDWEEYGGKLSAQRKANAERQKRHRERQKGRDFGDSGASSRKQERDVTPSSSHRDGTVTVTSPLRNAPENSREEKSTDPPSGEGTRPRVKAADAALSPKRSPSRVKAQQPVPLPDDFEVTVHMRGWALQHTDLSELEIEHETEKFRHYFVAEGKEQVDWVAKWRSWMLRATEYRRDRGPDLGHVPRPPAEMTDEEAERFYLRDVLKRKGA